MYKNVKLRVETWKRLRALQQPGESFDATINRLLTMVAELEARVKELEARTEPSVEECVRRDVDSVMLDKAAWYVTKMLFSIQALKERVTHQAPESEIEKQLRRLSSVLEQINKRYGVETRTLMDVALQFVKERSREELIILNEAAKEVVKSIIVKLLALNVVR